LGPDRAGMIDPDSAAGKIVVFVYARLADGHPDMRSQRFLPAFPRPAAGLIYVLPQLPPVTIYTRLKRFSVATTARMPLAFLIGEATERALFGADPAIGAHASGTLGGRVRYLGPDTIQARNVVAILRGSDSKRSQEYVGIGAHNDHVGTATFG